MKNILDQPCGIIGDETFGESIERSITKLLDNSLGLLYWKKYCEANQKKDDIAAEYWFIQSINRLTPQQKRERYIK